MWSRIIQFCGVCIDMRRVIKECRSLTKPYDIKFRVKYLPKDLSGYSDFAKRLIIINRSIKDRNTILGTLFHELVHFYCYDNNIYHTYHHSEELEDKLRFGVKVERYVDSIAEKWLKEYDSRLNYNPSYIGADPKEIRDFFIEFYKE